VKLRVAALSATPRYSYSPPKVALGCATSDSDPPTSRIRRHRRSPRSLLGEESRRSASVGYRIRQGPGTTLRSREVAAPRPCGRVIPVHALRIRHGRPRKVVDRHAEAGCFSSEAVGLRLGQLDRELRSPKSTRGGDRPTPAAADLLPRSGMRPSGPAGRWWVPCFAAAHRSTPGSNAGSRLLSSLAVGRLLKGAFGSRTPSHGSCDLLLRSCTRRGDQILRSIVEKARLTMPAAL